MDLLLGELSSPSEVLPESGGNAVHNCILKWWSRLIRDENAFRIPSYWGKISLTVSGFSFSRGRRRKQPERTVERLQEPFWSRRFPWSHRNKYLAKFSFSSRSVHRIRHYEIVYSGGVTSGWIVNYPISAASRIWTYDVRHEPIKAFVSGLSLHGCKTQDGRMTKKCRARPGMHSLAPHFFVILPSRVLQPSW